MVDSLCIFQLNDFLEWKPEMPNHYCYNGLDFKPRWDNKGYIKKYMAFDEFGFAHSINRKEYKIENSIHKMYSKINGGYGNHNDFYLSQFIDTFKVVCKLYKLNPKLTYIRKLEIGINVVLDVNPMDYINKIQAFQFKKPCTEMRLNNNKSYGKKIYTTAYQLKLYHKTIQMFSSERKRINDNILRYEAVLKKPKLISLGISSVADLLVLQNLWQLVDFLHGMLYEIKFNTDFDTSDLTSQELMLFYAGSQNKYWSRLAKYKQPTASRTRKRHNELIKNLEDKQPTANPLIRELRLRLEQKINQLSLELPTCYIA